MNSSKVLIITNKEDITVDFVVNELNKRRIDFYRLNTEEIGKSLDVYFDLDSSKFLLYDEGVAININSFKSVYYRRPKAPEANGLTVGEQVYYVREHEALLEGIYQVLRNKKWLNNVYSIRLAENKIYQQIVANEIGFLTPKRIITNKKDKALHFINNGDAIFKPMKNGFIEEVNMSSKVLFTNVVDDNFKKKISSIKSMPIYFQNLIYKLSDIRVTVVGDNINVVEIDSQNTKDAEIDWRRSQEIPHHKQIFLDESLNKQILELCKRFNLKFAAIDFIRDINNKLVFLEINPNGQWGWIEKILNINISSQIADYLTCA